MQLQFVKIKVVSNTHVLEEVSNYLIFFTAVFDLGDIVHGRIQLSHLNRSDIFYYLKHDTIPEQEHMITQQVLKGTEKGRKPWHSKGRG